MSDSAGLIVGVLLLLGNAFFVGAEFAVISARRSQIEPRAEAGQRSARITLQAMEQVSLMLAMAQLGITMCSLGLGAVAEPALAHLLEPVFHMLHVPSSLEHPIAFVLAMAVVVYLHVVVGEMIPKNVSLAIPDQAALVLAPALMVCAQVCKPVIVSLNWVANQILRLFGVDPKDEVNSAYTAEQVQTIVDESHKVGLLDDDPALLTGALEFSERTAGDVMVSLSDIVTLPVDGTPQQLQALVRETGYSRFPVCDAGGSMPGYVHLKDVLYADAQEYVQQIPEKRIRPFVSVPESAEVEDALASMQKEGAHLGRVVGVSGDTLGVIFMEDVLEELVGEITDEIDVPSDR